MPQDYAAVNRQDGDLEQRQGSSSSSSSSKPASSYLDPALNWIAQAVGSSKGENAPLINRGKGTLDLPRKTLRKIIVTVCSIVGTIFIIGAVITWAVMWNGDEPKAPPKKKLTDPEKIVIGVPSSDSVREYLRTYTSEPHLAGTDADKRQAEWTRDKFIEFGINDTKIETYYPLLNYPLEQKLAIVSGPEELRYEASLKEDVVDEDNTSSHPNATALFHGYSKNGTALGPVVYANYGRIEDFQLLVDRGINLQGTIALMRYGGAFRGLKLRAAEQFGCIGGLVYSDPLDDGPTAKENYDSPAKAYPEGPWRSPSSVQRGSVQFASIITGDPTTPGWAATENAERIKRDESPGMTQIPSLPLSYKDALPLLRATQSRGVCDGEDWAGGLDGIEYCSGPTEGDAYLVNIVEDKITPIWNVIGRIEGDEEPDRAIILGNHRDAWVFGAVDPSSGSAAMLELVRTLGTLVNRGWKPRRTIIIASWDAEEYGMVGSTEWVEDHREWLNEEAIVYVNVDMGVAGHDFMARGCPSLQQLVYEVTREVPDPGSNNDQTVYEAWRQQTNEDTPEFGLLGSGSDFIGFISHVGVTSLDFAFTGNYGVYHSNYDSFHWMEKFGDPTFKYHETLVKIWGLLTLRLADDRILPLYPGDYSTELGNYVKKLPIYESFTGPLETYETFGGPYKPFFKSLKKLTKAARRFERRRGRLEGRLEEEFSNITDTELPSVIYNRMKEANERLMHFERGFIDPEGLKDRAWFKHVIYAPEIATGYSSQVFPALAEAFKSGDAEQIGLAIHQTASRISGATELLKTDYDDDDDDDDEDDDEDDD